MKWKSIYFISRETARNGTEQKGDEVGGKNIKLCKANRKKEMFVYLFSKVRNINHNYKRSCHILKSTVSIVSYS